MLRLCKVSNGIVKGIKMKKFVIRDDSGNDIIINDDKIFAIVKANDKSKREVDFDASNMYVLSGFIDIHTHGADGVDVNDADVEGLKKISRFFAKQGVTGWFCSILTDTKERTLRQIRVAKALIDEIEESKKNGGYKDGAKLLGIHLEGPCLSVEYKGAMPEHLLMKEADLDTFREYQEVAGGNIKYITIAPEIKNAIDIIPKLKELGMVVSIGHSAAGYDVAKKAVNMGAEAATHLGNAQRLFHQHDPAIWGVALEENCYVETICDGLHLHPGSVRLYLKAAGWDRVVAITDCIMATGLPDGKYKLGINDVEVVNGDAKLMTTKVRAGSTLTLNRAMKNICSYTNATPQKVVKLMSENPAKLMSLHTKGSIEKNKDADLVILDGDMNVVLTMVGGNVVYKR